MFYVEPSIQSSFFGYMGTRLLVATAPDNTPHSPPDSSHHSIPHSNPHSLLHSNPHSPPHSNPHSTPNNNPHSPLHSTPHSALHSNPPQYQIIALPCMSRVLYRWGGSSLRCWRDSSCCHLKLHHCPLSPPHPRAPDQLFPADRPHIKYKRH